MPLSFRQTRTTRARQLWPPSPSKAVPVLPMSWSALEAIVSTVGKRPAESGGPLGGAMDEWPATRNGFAVTQFHFDQSGRASAASYTPDNEQLSRLFQTEWNPNGIRFKGFIHSHPGSFAQPSSGDEIYAERILKVLHMRILWLPIITFSCEGNCVITPWGATLRDEELQILRCALQITEIPSTKRLRLAGIDVTDIFFSKGECFSELRLPSFF